MTKARVLAARSGRDDVANLDRVIGHDDTVDEEFDQLAALLECGLGEAALDTPAEGRDGGQRLRQVDLLRDTRLEVAPLLLVGLAALVEIMPAALVFLARADALQVGGRQPLQLLPEARRRLLQILAPRLHRLRQPGPALRALEGVADEVGLRDHRAAIGTDRGVELLGGAISCRAPGLATGLDRMGLAAAGVLGMARAASEIRQRLAGPVGFW